MFYKYDENQLKFVKNKLGIRIALGTTILLMVGSFFIGRYFQSDTLDNFENGVRIINLQKEKDKFSKERFVEELKNKNVKFPYIVMAQAIMESGLGKSNLFKENNNLFGMRQARSRMTTAAESKNNLAYYNKWQDCVLDMAYFQASYLNGINSEEKYLLYLGANYAESPTYIAKLKSVIKEQKLKSYFNE
jgi:flagellum-specific peptidoglycan hydrolase FlgJ